MPTKRALVNPALGLVIEDGREISGKRTAAGLGHSALLEEVVKQRGASFVDDAFAPPTLLADYHVEGRGIIGPIDVNEEKAEVGTTRLVEYPIRNRI